MVTTSWTRAVRFIAAEDGKEYIGEPADAEVDVGLATFEGKPVKVNVLSGSTLLDLSAKPTGKTLTIKQVLSPISGDECGSIRCIGLNYRKHAAEANLPEPANPVLFLKPATSMSGPYPDVISVHKSCQNDQTDYESELAFVIGKTAKDVSEADAYDYILGYACSNDVSFRKWQGGGASQWCYGKGFDKACPLGPVLVSPKAIPDPAKLHLKGTRNGKVAQESGVDDLIFSVPKLVAFLSQGTTLPVGTVVQTGTPSGIGLFSKNLLNEGDDFRVIISGGLGTLINIVKHEK